MTQPSQSNSERHPGQLERAREAGLSLPTIESVRQGCYSDAQLDALIGTDLRSIPDDAYCDCCGLRLARVRASVDCVLCARCAADGFGIPTGECNS